MGAYPGCARRARDWNMHTEIPDQGGWADAIWGYTDAITGIDSPVESAPEHIDEPSAATASTDHPRPARAR